MDRVRNVFRLMYLEELNADTSEHELKERGHNHDVTDRPDGHKHTLNHMLHEQRDREKT